MSKPFLKWAGCKYPIADELLPYLSGGKRLIIPFAGACGFALQADYHEIIISDTNADLIHLYKSIRDDADAIISKVETLFSPENLDKQSYYENRDAFNGLKVGSLDRAALFVYLNKVGFRGLCRYNNGGGFNVPYGYYKNPMPPWQEMANFAEWIERKNVQFFHADFRIAFTRVSAGDHVYCDPPYLPKGDGSGGFDKYSKGGFSLEDHRHLEACARSAQDAGARVVISNRDTELANHLYSHANIYSIDGKQRDTISVGERHKRKEIVAVYRPEEELIDEGIARNGGSASEGQHVTYYDHQVAYPSSRHNGFIQPTVLPSLIDNRSGVRVIRGQGS